MKTKNLPLYIVPRERQSVAGILLFQSGFEMHQNKSTSMKLKKVSSKTVRPNRDLCMRSNRRDGNNLNLTMTKPKP